jgi:hypothetical protein
MSMMLDDLGGLALATLLTPLTGVLPGFALVGFVEHRGFDAGTGWARAGWATLLGLTLLPSIDALAVRTLGLAAVVTAHLALAMIGLPSATRFVRETSGRLPRLLLVVPLWWSIVAFGYVDFDRGEALHQSLLVLDLVKHAAVIETIFQHGLPLHDPFFARSEPAGYYYYYYLAPAMVRWLAHGLADSRMTFAASVFWTGIATPAALWQIARNGGLVRPGHSARTFAILTGLCFVGGADLPFALIQTASSGVWQPQTEWWSEEVRFALGSVLWVPHHMSALLAFWTGALLIERARHLDGAPMNILVGAAGLQFATGFGMSVWIAVAAAPILAIWQLAILKQGWRQLFKFAAAAVFALIIASPQIYDLTIGRAQEGIPLTLSVRSFSGITSGHDGPTTLLLIFLLPVSYLIEFGAFAYGTRLYFKERARQEKPVAPIALLLVISAVIGLIETGFLRSTVINNDFGWRSIWFAQLPAMIWTGIALEGLTAVPLLCIALLGIGVLNNIWDAIGLRLIREPAFTTRWEYINSTPGVDYAERQAYQWANSHLPAGAVIQANPGAERIFNFGLYGRNPTAVADREAGLFGGSKEELMARRVRLQPVFETRLDPSSIRRIAREEGIDVILFSSRDPVWLTRGTSPPGLPCIYRNREVCLVSIEGIAQ